MPDSALEYTPLSISLQMSLSSAFSDALRTMLERWEELQRQGTLTEVSARDVMQQVFSNWPELAAGSVEHLVDRLFIAGFMRGVLDVQNSVFGIDQQDVNVLEWMKTNPNGFIPALNDLATSSVKRIEKVIEASYSGEIPFDLDTLAASVQEVASVGPTRAALIVRTETAKATSLGRIMAWGDDPERDWYDYYWIATHDDRAKDISLKWDAEGPYPYDKIRHLWLVEHNAPQYVRNRHTGKYEWQVSAYNCRCTAARLPKSAEKLKTEGLLSQEEFEEMGGR